MSVRKTRITVYTDRHKIKGYVHLRPHEYRGRLSDFLNDNDTGFVPITDAVLYETENSAPLQEGGCVILNKSSISLVIPDGDEDEELY
jgi:hypothetical protein